jgi:MoaA/NifB/PqqE/SkfB family radical SAM enzyme
MVGSAYRHCRPEYITIPTNGLLPDRILAQAETIVRTCDKAQVGINLSLDGVGEVHDDIRGVPGNWNRSMETWRRLKELQTRYSNLVLTVHTVISRFNIHLFEETYQGCRSSSPTATSPRWLRSGWSWTRWAGASPRWPSNTRPWPTS